MTSPLSRRAILTAGLYTTVGWTLAACTGPLVRDNADQALAEATTSPPATTTPTPGTSVALLDPTPACADDDDPTPAQTAGPFYTPDTPQRASLLEPDLPGTRLLVAGTVLNTACQPIAGALLDFWQADDAGVYDNTGYRLRGHQFADEQGRYQLETIVPGLYPGRTRHIHVRVQPPAGDILTTQLYFPDEAQNARDGLYRPDLVMGVRAGTPVVATFDFIVNI